MDKISHALTELQEMDELNARSSPIHDMHPLIKLLVTLAYIVFVVSFDKYELSGLMIMVLYPIAAFTVSGIPVRTCFYKLRIVMPLVCAVGLVNPFFDKAPLLYIGSVAVSGGVVSMLTLMLKGVFALMASFLLIATTPMDSVCAALRKLHVPGIIVTLLLLTYRYIAVMLDEVKAVIQNLPNVIDFLGERDGTPTPMRQGEINRLLGVIDEQMDSGDSQEESFIVGEPVKVIDGPFNSFSGIVEGVNSEKKKLTVTVKIFGRKTPLELSFNQVEKE